MDKKRDDDEIFNSLIENAELPENPEIEQRFENSTRVDEDWAEGNIDLNDYSLAILLPHIPGTEYVRWKIKTHHSKEDTIRYLYHVIEQLKQQTFN